MSSMSRNRSRAEDSPDVAPGRSARGATVRVAPLIRLPEVLTALGFAPEEVLGRAGYDQSLFDNPDRPIPYVAAGSLIAHCVAVTGCEHLGLLLGEQAGPDTLGLPGFLLMSAPDVGTALHDLIRHLDLHDRGGVPTLETSDHTSLLGFAIVEPDVPAIDQIHDLCMAVAYNTMRSLCGSKWSPTEVLLLRRRPADAAYWRSFFRAPVRFDADRCALVFSPKWLTQPVAAGNPVLHRFLERRADELRGEFGSDFVSEVRRVVHGAIAHRRCSASQVAQQLGLHERTLNRRLLAEGTSFRQIRDEAVYGMSRQLLTATSMPLADVAAALGYAEASSFIRAFARWSGQPPRQWRREQEVGQAAAAAPRRSAAR